MPSIFIAMGDKELTLLSVYDPIHKAQLSVMEFVPWYQDSSEKKTLQKFKPSECYLTADPNDVIYSQIFRFVDGYSTDACVFLRMCGAKDSPTADDIMTVLANDPNDFLRRAGSEERYQAVSLANEMLVLISFAQVLRRVESDLCEKA
jgi:hypothetical protein